MGKETGWDQATISRLWRANGLKPHRVAYLKVSTDPEFVAKLPDVVGLYVNPPKRLAGGWRPLTARFYRLAAGCCGLGAWIALDGTAE